MPLAGQVHACWKCTRRLNVDNVRGSVTVLCPRCRAANALVVSVRVTTRG